MSDSTFKGGIASQEGIGFGDKHDLFTDFRFPYKRAILRWIILTVCCFSIGGLILAIYHIKMYQYADTLRTSLEESGARLEIMQGKLSRVIGQTNIDKSRKEKREIFSLYKQKYEIELQLLHNISKIIPIGTWLTRLDCKAQLYLEGFSPSYPEVMTFYAALARLKCLKRCCLRYDQQKDLLKFLITADLE